ncbi:MAG: PHP domain-containing protein [Chloroflexota bacterium]
MQKLKVEFHCHTIYSKDSLVRPRALVQAARRKGLDRVIVTDHNSTGGALEAQSLAPDLIIIGEEIMTTQGELLAAFVTEELPPGLEPQEAIRRLRAQGAFISVSHPFDVFRSGHWDPDDLFKILPLVDAIETFNARCMNMRTNQQAQEFARLHNLAGTVGSDAHTAFELGWALLELDEFETAEDLKRVIRSARAVTRLSSPLIHVTSRYATILKKLGFGV